MDLSLRVGNVLVKEKKIVKYLGILLDNNLSFQEEVKSLLEKMAMGIKTIYSIRCCLPQSLMRTMFNAFVLSHLHYSLPVIQSINQQLICSLERQLNWAIKACYFRSKFDSSRDLKISNQILPISLFIKYKRVSYFWKV